MDQDLSLLRDYVRENSQDAFADLVRRYVDMVYAAALRQVRDPGKAEDVTQAVFIVLSRKAKGLNPNVVLGGWLLNTVRFVVADLQRAQRRREIHEQRAAQMKLTQSATDSHDKAWEELAPALDDALSRLSTKSRDAVVLKYFESKTSPEVAARLGISEAAARKRLSRAIDELRSIFAANGITVSSALLGEVMTLHLISHAPAHLAAATTTAAASTAIASPLAKGAIKLMTLAKAKAAAAVLITATIVTGGAVATVQTINARRAQAQSPAPTAGQSSPAQFVPPAPAAVPGIKIPTASSTIHGIVRDAAGKPLAGAGVFLATANNAINVYDPRVMTAAKLRTGSDGTYTLTTPPGDYLVLVIANEGYAEASSVALAKSTDITVRPWSSIEGVALDGTRPVAGVEVTLWRYVSVTPWGGMTYQQTRTRSDAAGRFKFLRVVPGEVWLSRSLNKRFMQNAAWTYLVTDPGKNHQVKIGGIGRPVIGKLTTPASTQPVVWLNDQKTHMYQTNLRMLPGFITQPPIPQSSLEEFNAAREAWGRTPAGILLNSWTFGIQGTVKPDGSFHFADVPPGEYEAYFSQNELVPEINSYEGVATVHFSFTVPPVKESRSDEPFDVGDVECKVMPRLYPGHIMPELRFPLSDNSTWKLSNQKGKPTVIVFWLLNDVAGLKARLPVIQKWLDQKKIHALGIEMSKEADEALSEIAKRESIFFPLVSSDFDSLPYDFHSPVTTAIVIDATGRLVQYHINNVETLDKLIQKAVEANSPKDSEF